MAIYHHVASKEEIVNGMVDAVFTEIDLPPAEDDWKHWRVTAPAGGGALTHRAGGVDHIRLDQRGADLEVESKQNKMTPLLLAIEQGQSDTVGYLLDQGARIDGSNSDGLTPLMSASEKGDKNLVKLLLGRGAEVNAARKDGWTPLLYAAAGAAGTAIASTAAAATVRATASGSASVTSTSPPFATSAVAATKRRTPSPAPTSATTRAASPGPCRGAG